MHRTFSVSEVEYAIKDYRHQTFGFYPLCWLADIRNIALSDGEGNLNLLQYESNGVYFGHTFYTNKRGRQALDLLKEALYDVFTLYPVEIVKGLTPLQKVGARWISRKAGFTSHGVLHTTNGPCELFILDKQSYLENLERS